MLQSSYSPTLPSYSCQLYSDTPYDPSKYRDDYREPTYHSPVHTRSSFVCDGVFDPSRGAEPRTATASDLTALLCYSRRIRPPRPHTPRLLHRIRRSHDSHHRIQMIRRHRPRTTRARRLAHVCEPASSFSHTAVAWPWSTPNHSRSRSRSLALLTHSQLDS